ncbi:hypothetical protein J7J18_03690 [bacterium]|nr:hypothetical protein [bacterium]
MKLSKTEKLAIEFLEKVWKDMPKPFITVHSAYGLMRRYGKSVGYWLKVLNKLKEKGLVELIDERHMIWRVKK